MRLTALSPVLLTKDRVHEQHFSSVHIRGELGIEDLGFLCLLITLDEDLANADGAAAVPETLLHGLTCGETHNASCSEDVHFDEFIDLEPGGQHSFHNMRCVYNPSPTQF